MKKIKNGKNINIALFILIFIFTISPIAEATHIASEQKFNKRI